MEVTLRSCTASGDLVLAYAVLRELRPHLTDESFAEIYRESKARDGYELVGLWREKECLAVMGYRTLFDTVHGKHLYIDDLVTSEHYRSQGLGKRLLDYAECVAKETGCLGLRLCTGTQNTSGMKFYEREGWKQRSVVYKKGF